ncbi:MAG TPA: FliM/FliN family flagellar motor switch protein [Gemmatimonadales bacterium]|nr:FliM/FliN family flagellar motor switch protein [Gemmatimonadales bacterium]
MALIDSSAVEVVPYDFRRPPWISRERRAVLDGVHTRMTGELESVISSMVRPPVTVAVADVAQVTFGDWRAALRTPVAAYLAELAGRNQQLLLLFDPILASGLVHRMLGGGAPEGDAGSQLSAVEQAVLGRLATALVSKLRECHAEVAPFSPGTLRFEEIVESLEPVGSHERILLLELEIGFDAPVGRLTMALPAGCIDAFAAGPVRAAAPALPPGQLRAAIAASLMQARIPVQARLSDLRITARDSARLRSGQVFTSAQVFGGNVEIDFGHGPRFTGSLGRHEDRIALRVMEPATSTGRRPRLLSKVESR